MSEDLKLPAKIENDENWEEFEEEIKDRPERQKDLLKVGYVLNRYTDLEFSFVKKGEDVHLSCSQNVNMQSLFDDILGLWRD